MVKLRNGDAVAAVVAAEARRLLEQWAQTPLPYCPSVRPPSVRIPLPLPCALPGGHRSAEHWARCEYGDAVWLDDEDEP